MIQLEDRCLLSTIVWTNKFSDSFETLGINAGIAREVVDSALELWEQTIVDFNYVDPNTVFQLQLSVDPTEIGNGAVTYSSEIDSSGKPTSASIFLDAGWDGQGAGYFYEPKIFSDAYLGDLINSYVRESTPGHPSAYLGDFFTLVNHELIHAFGINSNLWGAFQKSPYLKPTGERDTVDNGLLFLFDAPSVDVLISAKNIYPNHIAKAGNTYVDSNNEVHFGITDVLNSTYAFGRRALVSATDIRVLEAAYGYTVTIPQGFWTPLTNADIVVSTDTMLLVVNSRTGQTINQLAQGGRTTLGDYNGDGIKDIVVATPAKVAPLINVYDGQTGTLVKQIHPFSSTMTNGMSIAVGDVNQDNHLDFIVGSLVGNPHVRIFDGHTNQLIREWFAFGLNFNVGVNLAVGDTNNDGYQDVIVGASVGNPHVRIYSSKDWAEIASWFAYDTGWNIGVTVAVKNGLIVTGTTNGNPHVKSTDGKVSVFPYEAGLDLGVNVAISSRGDIITAPTKGNQIKVIDSETALILSVFVLPVDGASVAV